MFLFILETTPPQYSADWPSSLTETVFGMQSIHCAVTRDVGVGAAEWDWDEEYRAF